VRKQQSKWNFNLRGKYQNEDNKHDLGQKEERGENTMFFTFSPLRSIILLDFFIIGNYKSSPINQKSGI
jgi:hypothetical protein